MHNQFKAQKFKHPMLAMGPRDLNSAPYSPVHCGSHSMMSFQSSELTELSVVENSQLFAQRAHNARYAPTGMHPTPCSPEMHHIGWVNWTIGEGKGPVHIPILKSDNLFRTIPWDTPTNCASCFTNKAKHNSGILWSLAASPSKISKTIWNK